MSFGLKAEDQVTVTGLIDDVDGEIVDMRAELYDFKGKAAVKTCIKLVIKPDGVEETSEEYYSVGDPLKVVPDEDGLGCGPAPGSKMTGYNNKSKAGLLTAALAGLVTPTPAKFDGYRGLRFHFDRKPFDTSFVKNKDPKQNDSTVLLPTKLVGGGASKSAPASGGGDASADEAVILAALKVLGGSASANAVGKQVFKANAANPKVKDIVKRTTDKEWMGHDDRPWVVAADGTLQATS